MAAPIFVEIGSAAEGAELTRAMGRHGLAAGLVRSGARWQVEINSPLEDQRSFLAGVGVALAAWNGGERHGGASRGSP